MEPSVIFDDDDDNDLLGVSRVREILHRLTGMCNSVHYQSKICNTNTGLVTDGGCSMMGGLKRWKLNRTNNMPTLRFDAWARYKV